MNPGPMATPHVTAGEPLAGAPAGPREAPEGPCGPPVGRLWALSRALRLGALSGARFFSVYKKSQVLDDTRKKPYAPYKCTDKNL